MTDFGPRQYCNRLLCPEKRLKQQEDTDAEAMMLGQITERAPKTNTTVMASKACRPNLTLGVIMKALPGLLSTKCMKGMDVN